MKKLILPFLLLGLTSCVTRSVTVTHGTTTMTIKGVRPGWPWTLEGLDVNKLSITTRTNGVVSFGAAGALEQVSNTNFNAMIDVIIQSAVKAAAASAK